MQIKSLLAVLSLAIATTTTVAQKPRVYVTGVPVSNKNGPLPYRRNINDLQSSGGPQWDLYIQALNAMQQVDWTQDLSYFQIMGIHGRPFVEWNGGGGRRSNDWLGYCPHGEKLFLPWHRPYIALYEQVLVQHAKRIADGYPPSVKKRYQDAAAALRSPFWDWGVNSNVPQATVPKTMTITVARGSGTARSTVNNPLAGYRFPSNGPSNFPSGPQINHCPSPDSYPASANRRMGSRPYKNWIYEAFTRAKNFADFASTGTSGISLEQIHNGVHWDAACGQQFVSSEFSGFDPLFMLHHTNIDRLWAYWQYMKPADKNFGAPYAGGSRFSTPGGSNITPESPLNPFFRKDSTFHTSNSVTDTRAFGYAYVGLETWSKNAATLAKDATAEIKRLYGPSNSQRRLLRREDGNITTAGYFVALEVDVEQMERPCSIEVYVSGKQVGSFIVMQQPSHGTVHGGFPIDDAVEQDGISTVVRNKVVQDVKSSIEIAIVKKTGERIKVSDALPGLKFEIQDSRVTIPEEETKLPVIADTRVRTVKVAEFKGRVDLSG